MARNSPSLFRSWIERLLRFRTGLVDPDYAEGTLFYDNTNKCLGFMADISGNILQIGQESYVRAVNKTGVTIAERQAVYINGYDAASGRPTIALARADVEATALCVGLTTTVFANNGEGFVTVFGTIRNIDTSAFASGAALYLSDTVAGGLTTTRPVRPSMAVAIGFVGAVNATTGTINVLANRVRHQDVLGANLGASSITFPTRTLNSNFTPSTLRPVFGVYTVRIATSITLSGGAEGTVALLSDTAATPTTLICDARSGLTGTVIGGIAINNVQDVIVCGLIQPGYNARLTTTNNTGTPTFTLVRSVEYIL